MLLYTWLIPHADNLGRFHGEPEQVKSLVLPRRPDATSEQVAGWLEELSERGLIYWYAVDGLRYIEFPEKDWKRHQRLTGNMRKTSDLPSCPESVRTAYEHSMYGVSPEVEVEVEVEGEAEGEREVEGKGESLRGKPPTPPNPTRPYQPVRKRTETENLGPAFWNSPEVQSRMDRLSALEISEDEARRLVVAGMRSEGKIP